MKFKSLFLGLILGSSMLSIAGCKNSKKNDSIIDDLERNADGSFNVEYLNNVKINLWSVIGDPDKEVLENLVKQFNKQYAGMIEINLTSVGHYDYYNALDTTYVNEFQNFPDLCLLHNEKTIEYAAKDYFRPVDDFISDLKMDLDFNNVYDNIEKATIMNDKHYGIPIDAHGYLAQIRQDIIKKNGLGFDGNTRFIPQNYNEYQTLLESLRQTADSGNLWVRNLNKATNDERQKDTPIHQWYKLGHGDPKATAVCIENFFPAFFYSPECDNLSALYVNGGSLLDSNGNVNFQNCRGFERYVTDLVNRYNSDLLGDAGNKEAAFPIGQIGLFSEGPWQVANTYDYWWNNSELKTANKLGVSEEDANDPIYQNPYIVSRPRWFASPETTGETATKWYGNGHVFSITTKMDSMSKIAAGLFFAKWYTQAKNESNEYNLVTWCKSGHVPAWKNVYESSDYKQAASNSMTLTAMGDPQEIISLESTEFATTLINGVNLAVGSVAEALLSQEGCTVELAKQKIQQVANSTQEAINIMKL